MSLDRLKLLLHEKYGLVHIPNRHKTERWAELTRTGIREGTDAEQAGLAAARRLFPYELKEHAVYSSASVEELLRQAGPSG
jgi:hypothetical protein